MSQKWAIELSIEGDLRFLSHHDMMRAMERLARRAKLPLRYSQGFNPRPVLSLATPRPVGVASRAELLVLALEEELEPHDLVDRMNAAAPPGLRAAKARKLGKTSPRAKSARYRLPLAPDRLPAIRTRLDELAAQDSWPLERAAAPKDSRSDSQSTTRIDLRKLVHELRLEDSRLAFTLSPQGDVWARPGEVLTLLGLDGRVDLAQVVRVDVDYDL